MLIKTVIVWIFIAFGEIINGNIRVRYLQRKFGQYRAKKISFFLEQQYLQQLFGSLCHG